MRKRIYLIIIVACILVLAGLRILSPEDTRICDGNTLVKHGNPSSNGSGFFCLSGERFTQTILPIQNTPMLITTDFTDKGLMPSSYTCDGDGRFPTLTIEYLPAETKSLALIVDDPDSLGGVRDHLLLANIPLPESGDAIISQDTFDQGILGQNGRGEQARGAPCPPSGTHRYTFKVYAISEKLDLSSGFSRERLIELMGGKIVDQSQIVGLYKRQ